MRRGIVLAVTAAVALAAPATAPASERWPQGGLRDTYEHRLYDAKRDIGVRARNIATRGVLSEREGARPASKGEIARASRHFKRRMSRHYAERRAAAARARAATPQPQAASSSSSSSSGGAGGAEQFVACESGGDWNARNPSSGAFGRYQLMPQHYQGGGLCSGLGQDPGGQTECAGRVYESQGSAAWSACGG
jgi:hypothetical protein